MHSQQDPRSDSLQSPYYRRNSHLCWYDILYIILLNNEGGLYSLQWPTPVEIRFLCWHLIQCFHCWWGLHSLHLLLPLQYPYPGLPYIAFLYDKFNGCSCLLKYLSYVHLKSSQNLRRACLTSVAMALPVFRSCVHLSASHQVSWDIQDSCAVIGLWILFIPPLSVLNVASLSVYGRTVRSIFEITAMFLSITFCIKLCHFLHLVIFFFIVKFIKFTLYILAYFFGSNIYPHLNISHWISFFLQ